MKIFFFALIFITAINIAFAYGSELPCNMKTESDTSKINLSHYGVKDKWLGIDKLHHFYYSASMTGLSYFTIHYMLKYDNGNKNLSRLISGSSAFAIGFLKELYDKKHSSTGFSYKDLTFDLLGVVSGIFVFTLYER